MKNKKADSISNSNKSKSGNEWDNQIRSFLEEFVKRNVIKGFDKNVHFNHSSFKFEKQFLANFVIYTNDNKRIIVRSTKSWRDSRAKIAFYDLEGILKYSNLSDSIISSVFLVPNKELKNKSFLTVRKRIANGDYFCPVSHLLTQDEFEKFLNNYTTEHEDILQGFVEELIVPDLKAAGSYYGKKGNEMERAICSTFNSAEFLKKLVNGENPKFSEIFYFIIKKYNITVKEISSMSASNSIPLLRSGGSPKTDLIIKLHTGLKEYVETFSVKTSTKENVSVHDYKSNSFIDVLNCKGDKLETYFNKFQNNPTYKDFKDSLVESESEKEFGSLLKKQNLIFCEWVVMGRHDLENLIYPEIQISNNLIINTPKINLVCESENYIKYLLLNIRLKYGVPFSWTYPSKQRGKRIQLKIPLRNFSD